MTTIHIQSLLQRQSRLNHDIDHAESLLATLERYKASDVKGTLYVVGAAGNVKLDASLTKHLACGALEDLHSEKAALDAKIEAINTLLAE